MTAVVVILVYFAMLLGLGFFSARATKGTSGDYFLASHSIGPFMLFMSIFGTTMTSFAMVGSTGEAYVQGIGVYGLMASWSGLVHAGVFFLIGIKLWAFGKKFGYSTQVQFFRDRFESDALGTLLFPVLVLLVIPYILTGLIGGANVIQALTRGAFPDLFPDTKGGVPPWLSSLFVSGVVLAYIFYGGIRGAVWANTFQTLIFMVLGCVTFFLIANKLGGASAATEATLQAHPELLDRGKEIAPLHFLTYGFVPLSVGMFPHLFQHWLTAKSAKAFRFTVVAHPIAIMIVWAPCVLIGIWASSAMLDGKPVVPPGTPPNAVLGMMIGKLTGPIMGGLLGAGVLAAIMSSLDSQFVCLGTMFTNDVVTHHFGEKRFTDRQHVLLARGFIVAIVAVCYFVSLFPMPRVFRLGVWCFSGFAALFPVVFAAIYWRRATAAGAIAAVIAVIVSGAFLFLQTGYAGTVERGAPAEPLFLGMMPVATMVALSTAALVLVSLATRPPSAETVRRFIPD